MWRDGTPLVQRDLQHRQKEKSAWITRLEGPKTGNWMDLVGTEMSGQNVAKEGGSKRERGRDHLAGSRFSNV